jgi:Glycosyl hydrolases family 39
VDRHTRKHAASFSWVAWACLAGAASGAEVKLLTKPHDPYGVPRPAPGQQHVPLRTSFYVELGPAEKNADDPVLPESVAVELQPEGAEPLPLLRPGRQFAAGYTGKFLPGKNQQTGPTLAVYVDGEQPLRPATRYTVRVQAKSRSGATLPDKAGTWRFTTEAAPATHPLRLTLAPDAPVVRWQGGFFTGVCNVSFCTSSTYRLPTFELMERVRKTAPRAWSLQRDFWLTGTEHRPGFLFRGLPNIVRERETRRVVAIDADPRGSLLRVEDFFGHEQYGIASGRPASADYHAGDEVLIADGVSDARATVVAADDAARTVLVTRVEAPKGGWKLAYAGPLPKKENPDAPGLFPPGGCYLRKFRPCGTPVYYWGRLDREWDLSVKRFHRRVLPNFADAPGDLSVNGRDWTTAKDYVELHEVTRAITGHILERYGEAALTFPWSVFNEPDLGILFWRSDWTELQKFYDYTTDAVLRAFEDHGYDSDRVFIGGLELGGIFGTNLRLREFLTHCSPRAEPVQGTLPQNAAFADARLEGKRSRRVERLCRAHGGRGAPCDFVSVHAYNRSQLMADKLARAKEMALEIDADYYAKLWVSSHEACPGWAPPPDPAYGDSYLGNGYFPTWCADVARRQLRRAAADPRYAFGESILTVWPWPNPNFGGGNDCVRALHADDDGDGVADRTVTVPMPILHFLGLVAAMGPEYQVLPEQTVGGHVVSGFASPAGGGRRVVLYAHDMLDTESRSEAEFAVTLDLGGFQPGPVAVREYRFDKDHNSYYRMARRLREQADAPRPAEPGQARRLQEALDELGSAERAAQLAALDKLAKLGPAASSAAGTLYEFLEKAEDPALRERATAVLKRVTASRAYPAAVVRQVEELAALHTTGRTLAKVGADGRLTLTVRVAGNGANYLFVEPAGPLLPFLLW